MNVRIIVVGGKYFITILTVGGTYAFIYEGTRVECLAMSKYHNFEVTELAP